MIRKSNCILAAVAAATLTTAASAQIVNPSFETTGSGIPGYTVEANNGDAPIDGTGAAIGLTAPDGTRQAIFFGDNADLNGNGGAFFQDVPVMAATDYNLSFQAIGIDNFPQDGFGPIELTVSAIDVTGGVAGAVLASQAITVTDTYDTYNLGFTALSPTVRLRFQETSASSAARDLAVDNLVLTQGVIPEPASLALAGLGGLTLLRRRRA